MSEAGNGSDSSFGRHQQTAWVADLLDSRSGRHAAIRSESPTPIRWSRARISPRELILFHFPSYYEPGNGIRGGRLPDWDVKCAHLPTSPRQRASKSRGVQGNDGSPLRRLIRRRDSEQTLPDDVRPPFTTAPVVDGQRSSDPLLFSTSARADSQRRWLSNRMRWVTYTIWYWAGVGRSLPSCWRRASSIVARPDPPEVYTLASSSLK